MGPGQSELALAGGRDRDPDRSDRREFAARMREAWEAHQGRDKERHVDGPDRERETSQEFAARLREAAAGVDPDALADRAAALRDGREAEERQAELDAVQERELEREKEIEKERDSIADRDRGLGHGL